MGSLGAAARVGLSGLRTWAIDCVVIRAPGELVYTAWDIRGFALDLGADGPPFVWDEERRAQLNAL